MVTVDGITDLERIGAGGFATVYRGRQARYSRDVAVKVLRGELTGDELARFDRECRTLGSLSHHPNIVTLHGSGSTDHGEGYMVLEFCPESVQSRIDTAGPLAWSEAATVLADIADAVAYAHERGVLHRDIKPDNVLYSPLGVPQLADFGIARMSSEFQTASGQMSGTVGYMAPEVLDGQPFTTAADVWALAATGYSLIGGSSPFVRETDQSLATVIARIHREDPPPLAPFGVPPALEQVLRSGLAKSPADRLGSAAELASGLRHVVGGAASAGAGPRAPGATALVSPVQHPVPEPPVGTPPRTGRRRALVSLAAITAVALLVAGWVVTRPDPGGTALADIASESADADVTSKTEPDPPGCDVPEAPEPDLDIQSFSNPDRAAQVLDRGQPRPEPPPRDTSRQTLDVTTLVEGDTDGPIVGPGSMVVIQFTSVLSDCSLVGSTWAHDRPVEFEVGRNDVITGLDVGLEGATIGERRHIVIGSDHGAGGDVPVAVDIDVLDVVNPPAEFTLLAAGGEHTCGLRPDSTVACWGSDIRRQATPPEGTFQTIAAGLEHTCGVRENGSVECWGFDAVGQASPPDGEFQALAAGTQSTCGIRTDGTLDCWGLETFDVVSPPEGTFSAISVGASFACGIRTDGPLTCWGSGMLDPGVVPDGIFTDISAGGSQLGGAQACAVRDDATAVCFGPKADLAVPPPTAVTDVAGSFTVICAVGTEGAPVCWGDDVTDQIGPPPSDVQLSSITAGIAHFCGLTTDSTAVCWGEDSYGQSTPPTN